MNNSINDVKNLNNDTCEHPYAYLVMLRIHEEYSITEVTKGVYVECKRCGALLEIPYKYA